MGVKAEGCLQPVHESHIYHAELSGGLGVPFGHNGAHDIGRGVRRDPGVFRLTGGAKLEGERDPNTGGQPNVVIYAPGFILSIGLVILLFFSGIKYFRSMERTFADMV